MDPGKEHFRHVLFFLFKRGKTAAEAKKILCDTYGDGIVSIATCRRWHRRFQSGNFDVSDRHRPGRPSRVEHGDLRAPLDDNSAVTTQELAEAPDVHRTTVCLHLHGMGKIQKYGKWVPHSLSESAKTDRLNTCKELLKNHRKKSFLWQIVMGDEKWVLYDNPKRKKHWMGPGQATTSTPNANIHGKKVLLCVWWDHHGVLYHELLKPCQTVTADVYCSQLRKLSQVL
ncbi:hypothetical protein M514_05576 [Trichuris suis]|uniref:Mos1 transposase HTH domain-containing protein n=1 Tax=Trichuris suis TaxID=68888 RepID=A0A085MS95_9BILA|nr:hypothetical protein M514_05576 [Trichuris suis]